MPHFWVSLGSVIGAGTDRGGSDVSGWPILTSSGKVLLECPVELSQCCAPLVQGSLLFAHGFHHVWGSYSECPVFLLFHTERPVTGTISCLFHALPLCMRAVTSHLCLACPMHAPYVPKGNVYLLGAAGHQALLQPEGLLLGARLGVVVPHQAPLDLEIMGWVGSGSADVSWPLPLAIPPLRLPPSARRLQYARGRCGRLGRCHSRGKT